MVKRVRERNHRTIPKSGLVPAGTLEPREPAQFQRPCRLNLIKFLVDPPNLLLMDEPTTHLDIHAVESPSLALGSYEGTLVFISRNVHFIGKRANRVLHVSNGKATPYPGGYDYFLEKTGALASERAALTARQIVLPRLFESDSASPIEWDASDTRARPLDT